MPELTCTGFSMFAQHTRIGLEAKRGGRFGSGVGVERLLINAVTSHWKQLNDVDKKMWRHRAKVYRKTDEFINRNRIERAKQLPPRRNQQLVGDTDDDTGVMTTSNASGALPIEVAIVGGECCPFGQCSHDCSDDGNANVF